LPRTAPLEEVVQPESQSFDNGGDMRRLAQRAVRIVWRLPGSRLAALTGSIATGHADLASDIDISLFGLKLADARVRRSLIAAMSDAPDDITQLTAETHAADAFWLDGRLADVRYFLISEARRLIADPVPRSQADYELLTRLSTADILVDYEFRGPNLTRDLQQATRRARDERMARASDHFRQAAGRLEASVEPPDIFCATVEAVLALFRLLAARNDRWILFPKWTAVWLEGLETVPPEFHARLSDVALLPFHRKNVQSKLDTLRAIAGEITGI
jgi:predicted nucleotidyltransferase